MAPDPKGKQGERGMKFSQKPKVHNRKKNGEPLAGLYYLIPWPSQADRVKPSHMTDFLSLHRPDVLPITGLSTHLPTSVDLEAKET